MTDYQQVVPASPPKHLEWDCSPPRPWPRRGLARHDFPPRLSKTLATLTLCLSSLALSPPGSVRPQNRTQRHSDGLRGPARLLPSSSGSLSPPASPSGRFAISQACQRCSLPEHPSLVRGVVPAERLGDVGAPPHRAAPPPQSITKAMNSAASSGGHLERDRRASLLASHFVGGDSPAADGRGWGPRVVTSRNPHLRHFHAGGLGFCSKARGEQQGLLGWGGGCCSQ